MILILLAFACGLATSALIAATLCARADRQDAGEVEAVAKALFRTDGTPR
jgi:hypothetical protein